MSQQAFLHPTPKFDERLMSENELLELIKESQKEDTFFCNTEISPEDLGEIRAINPKKPMTFMVFMAADNDLHYFAWKNIKQMEMIGSNENINIVVQLNTPGHLSPTKRYVIKKGKRLLVQDPESPSKKLNSGSPTTLIDFVEWGVTHYPADEYALILWNHGSGANEPMAAKTFNPCDLFYCDPSSNMLELDRSTGYINLILQLAAKEQKDNLKNIKGICFDESFRSYISNQEFEFALKEIHTKILKGKKLGLVAFDACLMSMIEIANICKKYAQYMVGSQEVEYGTGWNYEFVLKPFVQKTLSNKDFASHIVRSYEQAYHKIINDYTQSALDLELCDKLEENIHEVAKLLLETLIDKNRHQALNILKKCKSTQHCTCFDEPSYIDLGHFYKNLLKHLQYFKLNDSKKEIVLHKEMQATLENGLSIISQIIVSNKTGKKLNNAHGVSIFFPEHTMPQTYLKSQFALSNNWGTLLRKYLLN